jgi:hypothetical protein
MWAGDIPCRSLWLSIPSLPGAQAEFPPSEFVRAGPGGAGRHHFAENPGTRVTSLEAFELNMQPVSDLGQLGLCSHALTLGVGAQDQVRGHRVFAPNYQLCLERGANAEAKSAHQPPHVRVIAATTTRNRMTSLYSLAPRRIGACSAH